MNAASLTIARDRVLAPALALIILCSTWVVCLLLTLALTLLPSFTGTASRPTPPRNADPGQQAYALVIRDLWLTLVLGTNAMTLVGAVQMKGLGNHRLARNGCLLALVPGLGPFFLFGIPFAIWGLIVLEDPRVRAAFTT